MNEEINRPEQPAEETPAENPESETQACAEPQEEENRGEAPAKDAADAQEAALQKLIAERDEYLELAKRQKADFANYRRRNENARREAEDEGRRDTVRAFLPVLDNLERAIEAAGEEESPLKSGVDMVLRQMLGVLGQMKVEVIDPLGEAFDAEAMNAVMQGTAEEGEPGTVCGVLQKGYRMGGRVIRHAMVKVVAG